MAGTSVQDRPPTPSDDGCGSTIVATPSGAHRRDPAQRAQVPDQTVASGNPTTQSDTMTGEVHPAVADRSLAPAPEPLPAPRHRRAHPPGRLRLRRRRRRGRGDGPRGGRRGAGRRHRGRRPGLRPLGGSGGRLAPRGVRRGRAASDQSRPARRRRPRRARVAGRRPEGGRHRRDRLGLLLGLRRPGRPGRGVRLAHRPGEAAGQAADDSRPRRARRRAGDAAQRGPAGRR